MRVRQMLQGAVGPRGQMEAELWGNKVVLASLDLLGLGYQQLGHHHGCQDFYVTGALQPSRDSKRGRASSETKGAPARFLQQEVLTRKEDQGRAQASEGRAHTPRCICPEKGDI